MTAYDPQPPLVYAAPARPGNGFAVAALVLGLVALMLFCVWWLSAPCSILAIVFGVAGRKRAAQGATGGGMATAGVILGGLALAIMLAVIFGLLALLGIAGHNASSFGQALQQAQQNAPRPGG